MGNAAGGVEAVQLYVHARACFHLALAQLGGGGRAGGGVAENLGAVESNCRRRYRRLCEELPEARRVAAAAAGADRALFSRGV